MPLLMTVLALVRRRICSWTEWTSPPESRLPTSVSWLMWQSTSKILRFSNTHRKREWQNGTPNWYEQRVSLCDEQSTYLSPVGLKCQSVVSDAHLYLICFHYVFPSLRTERLLYHGRTHPPTRTNGMEIMCTCHILTEMSIPWIMGWAMAVS